MDQKEYIDDFMNNGLRNVVRSQLFATYRWMAELSAFLITASFAILAIRQDYSLTEYRTSTPILILMVIALGINVFKSFRLHSIAIQYYNGFVSGKMEEGRRCN